jgi:hypothetical protein
MAETLPAALGPPGAQNPAFDARLNHLLLTFVTAELGGVSATHDATLEVVNGEGQVWLDPPDLPILGEITAGQLTIASENFPSYAPLTLHLRGLELRLLAERSNLLAGGLYIGGRSVLRLQCAGVFHPALVYSLHWPSDRRLMVRRWDLQDENRQYELELEVLEGNVVSDRKRAGNVEGGVEARVTYNRIRLEPVNDLLRLRLIAARFVLDFHEGQVRLIRVFNGRGFVAAFAMRDLRGMGSALSVGFRDTLN